MFIVRKALSKMEKVKPVMYQVGQKEINLHREKVEMILQIA